MHYKFSKENLVSAPILGYTDFREPFIFETDASFKGLGAVLSHKIEGKERVMTKIIVLLSLSFWYGLLIMCYIETL